jgi:hypothetical protein
MPAVVELHDQYVAGKRSHGFGRHLANEDKPEPEPVVTLVAPGEIDRFIGARSYAERLRHLRRLRDDGLLISQKGRLAAQQRRGSPRAYAFRCAAHEVPMVDGGARNPRVTKPRGAVGRVRAF